MYTFTGKSIQSSRKFFSSDVKITIKRITLYLGIHYSKQNHIMFLKIITWPLIYYKIIVHFIILWLTVVKIDKISLVMQF